MPKKYLIAYLRYKSYFSTELETATYYVVANNMKEAIEELKGVQSIYQIIAISILDDSIEYEEIE